MSRNRIVICLPLAILLSSGAQQLRGQASLPTGSNQEMPLNEILDRMSQNAARQALDLKHYTSTRTYQLHNARFRKTAELTVKLTYRHPGFKEFQVLAESGPSAVRHQVLHRMMESEAEAANTESGQSNQISTTNYTFRLVGPANYEGRLVYVLEAAPKRNSKYLMRGQVWVDAEDFAVSRVVGVPAKNPSVWIRSAEFEYRYTKFGSFWLPVATDSQADALVFGHTEVKIRNQDYKINIDKEHR